MRRRVGAVRARFNASTDPIATKDNALREDWKAKLEHIQPEVDNTRRRSTHECFRMPLNRHSDARITWDFRWNSDSEFAPFRPGRAEGGEPHQSTAMLGAPSVDFQFL